MVPTEEFPPGIESTHHATVMSFAPVTTGVKVIVCPVVMAARLGLSVTAVVPGLTVTVMEAGAVLATSVTEIAVKVTTGLGEGTPEGPVYFMGAPDALEFAASVPQLLPLHPLPDSVHWTPAFAASFCTVAVKNWMALNWTLMGVGDTTTETAGDTVIVAA
jgi:hypothetical protein